MTQSLITCITLILGSLADTSHGKHGYIYTEDGLALHYVENGDSAKPLMLFIHGFIPEFWYSWRHQMDYFVQKGYYCVSIDLRGFNDSDKPEGMCSYGVDKVPTE